MSTHTKGPWTIEGTKDGQYERIQSHGYVIAWTGHKDFGSLPEHKVNAALIAAAPIMLEACKAMSIANTAETIDLAYGLIRAAIAAAEGGI